MVSATFELTTLEGLGKDSSSVWLPARLAEPAVVRHYESVKIAGMWP
jgi:hypothetical protein